MQENGERILIKEECEGNFGKFPEERTVEEKINNGLVLIDKPKGPSSHQVSYWVKEILRIKKAGHAGTLDPEVTGILPIALGRGTKIMLGLKGADKEYVGSMEIESARSEEEILNCAKKFVGDVEQVPPKFSAVRKVPRIRRIYELEILEVEGNFILFRIRCQAGFYVRVFCEQFALKLKTKGRMTDLRRTKFNCFSEEELVNLQELKDNYIFWKNNEENKLNEIIKPLEFGVRHLKKIFVKDSAIKSVSKGSPLGASGICKLHEGINKGDLIAIMSLKNELIALGKSFFDSEHIFKMEKGICAKIKRTFQNY